MAPIILAVVLAIFILPFWTLIHELSHVLMAKHLVNAKLLDIRIFPSINKQLGFVWGYVQWQSDITPTSKQRAAIVFAPRIANILTSILLPCAALFHNPFAFVIWTVLTAAGIVDLCNGSIGYSEKSDLRRGAEALQKSPWIFRLAGFSLAVLSVTAWTVLSRDQLLSLVQGLS